MARTVGSSAADTRGRILDGARELFVERGYAGTSIREISDRVRMTKGSLYYHFASKEELLSVLLTPLLTAMDECAASIATAGVTGDALRALVEMLDEHGPVLRALLGDPSVAHSMLGRLRLPQRITGLLEALEPSHDEAGRLRARCALGVINAGVLAPSDFTHKADGSSPPPSRPRLTDQEKDFVVWAALAVLTGHDLPGDRR